MRFIPYQKQLAVQRRMHVERMSWMRFPSHAVTGYWMSLWMREVRLIAWQRLSQVQWREYLIVSDAGIE